jgi:chromosomal replication initiation ATPase DnaA
MHERAHGSQVHNIAMWLLRQRGITLREIGAFFGGLDYAAVSQRIRRLEQEIKTDGSLCKRCEMLNV